MMPVMKGGAQAIALGDLNKDGHTDVGWEDSCCDRPIANMEFLFAAGMAKGDGQRRRKPVCLPRD